MKLSKIKEFTLGGVKWSVEINNTRLTDLNALGITEFNKSTISLLDKNIDENLIGQTLYHEVVHAILDTMCEFELSANEKFVQNFALLLHQFEVTKK